MTPSLSCNLVFKVTVKDEEGKTSDKVERIQGYVQRVPVVGEMMQLPDESAPRSVRRVIHVVSILRKPELPRVSEEFSSETDIHLSDLVAF